MAIFADGRPISRGRRSSWRVLLTIVAVVLTCWTTMKHAIWVSASVVMIADARFASGALVTTVAYDNVHIRVSDPANAGDWYVKHFGASPTETPGRVFVGKTLIRFSTTDGTSLFPPDTPTGGIDHIGLSVANLRTKISELEAAGAKATASGNDIPGSAASGFVEDPWGVKLGLVQDPGVLGFHHVHLSVPDPKATLDWYQEMFGGRRAKLADRLDGLRYGSVWLFAEAGGAVTVPSPRGLTWNQLAWQVQDIEQVFADLKRKGVPPIMDLRFRKIESQDVGTALVKDPNGIRIELLQRSQR